MPFDVWANPKVRKLKYEILESSTAKRLNKFFWLKAVKTRSGDPPIRLFSDKNPKPNDTDGEEYRIANIALQGGGVLGLAHAGFVAGLELAGIRFAGIAGASAGAIMAMGMAAVRRDQLLESTSDELVRIIANMPMSSFIDGPYHTRSLIKRFLLKKAGYGLAVWPAWLGAFRQILQKRGLNSGSVFEDWLRGALAEQGLRNVDTLNSWLKAISLHLERGKEDNAGNPLFQEWRDIDKGEMAEDLLQIMAACTPLGIKFQFPRDVGVLSAETSSNSPAAFVRASMSIPLFFEPAQFDVNKREWPAFVAKKLGSLVDKEKLNDLMELEQIAFLDGGIFSNLPVDAFRTTMPDVPMLAVPLTSAILAKPYRRKARLRSLIDDMGTVAFMVRNQRDRDAIEQLDRAKQRFDRKAKGTKDRSTLPPSHPFHLAPINVGDINWLNFTMDKTSMMNLFLIGLNRAKYFIETELDQRVKP
jgi:NTE family protein